MENIRMPRRALSTLRTEIKEDDSFGRSMELSDSTSVEPAEFSLELLIRSFRACFTEKTMLLVENPSLLGVLLLGMQIVVVVVEDKAIAKFSFIGEYSAVFV
jgi:hypothetical protein